MSWTPKRTLLAGLGLIVLVNAIALGGVAYNRSGEPDSVLALSEREVHRSYSGWADKENSGRSLTLVWRVLPFDTSYDKLNKWSWNSSFGAQPAWLDAAKMRSLGFHDTDAKDKDEASQRQLPRSVLLVLELNGDAYREALRRSEQYSKTDKGWADMFKDDQRKNSRLFVVDAGLDYAQLRAKYSDRSRFAIVHGDVSPAWHGMRNGQLGGGYVNHVHASELNIPLEWAPFYADAMERNKTKTAAAHYSIAVHFGQRLEPWIGSVQKVSP